MIESWIITNKMEERWKRAGLNFYSRISKISNENSQIFLRFRPPIPILNIRNNDKFHFFFFLDKAPVSGQKDWSDFMN